MNWPKTSFGNITAYVGTERTFWPTQYIRVLRLLYSCLWERGDLRRSCQRPFRTFPCSTDVAVELPKAQFKFYNCAYEEIVTAALIFSACTLDPKMIFKRTSILWPTDVKSWLIGKDSDAGKDWGQEKGAAKDEMVRQHHWLNGYEFEQTPGDGEGQGSLICCSSWGHKKLDMT